MKRTKKIACCLMSVLFGAAAFAGCAIGGDDWGDGNDGRTRLKVSFYEGGYGGEWMDKIAAAFEKEHPGVRVVKDGDYKMEQKVSLDLESSKQGGAVSDIYTVTSRGNFVNYVHAEGGSLLEDISDLYADDVKTEDGVVFRDTILPESMNTGKIDGKYYGVPWTTSVSGIIYNAKIFRDNGWSEPETVKELIDLCQNIKDAKLKQGNTTVAPLVYSGATEQGYFAHLLKSWFRMFEGEEGFNEFYEFGSAEVYKKDGRIAAYQTLANLLGSGFASEESDTLDYLAAQRAFIRGEAAMITAGSWLETEMSAFLKGYPAFEMKMMPTPKIGAIANGDGTYSLDLGGSGKTLVDKTGAEVAYINSGAGDNFVIPKTAKNKELAKEFLVFMASQRMLNVYTECTNSPRPYRYTNTDWSNLSTFGQSAMSVYQKSTTIAAYINDKYAGRLHEYMGGSYATLMDEAGSIANALNVVTTLVNTEYEAAKLIIG